MSTGLVRAPTKKIKQLDVGVSPIAFSFTLKGKKHFWVFGLKTFSGVHSVRILEKNGSWDMNFFLVTFFLVFVPDGQTDGQTEDDTQEPTVHEHRWAKKLIKFDNSL